jgi:probable HAF family extracellular repeat protein
VKSARPARTAAIAAATTAALAALLGLCAAPAGATTPAPTSYTARDLGTLGGTTSKATAVDRTTIVGESATAHNQATDAFAYDRAAGRMSDLGTLGGTSSTAVAVHGRHVVGDSTLPGDAVTHGFVYDLSKHRMRDLGTLGGTTSTVTALGGGTVVGDSTLPGDAVTHAFAYDLRTHVMTDLGSLTGPAGSSSAVGVTKGRYVVGNSTVAGRPASLTHGFVYDLSTGTMTDIGTGGGTYSKITDVSGRTVVGSTAVPTPGFGAKPHGFAYDLVTGAWTDLGDRLFVTPLVSGRHVVGWDGQVGWAYDLKTGALSGVGDRGVSTPSAITGKVAVGNEFAPNSFAFAYRTDTATLTLLPTLGGRNCGAAAIDAHGAVAGSAATPAPDPRDANGPFHAVLWTPSAA